MAKNWINSWLTEWAAWYETQLTGYSKTTVISKAMAGSVGNPNFESILPDIDPPRKWMRRLVAAMNSFRGRREMLLINRTQAIYLYGWRAVQAETGVTERQIRRWRTEGERLLMEKLG